MKIIDRIKYWINKLPYIRDRVEEINDANKEAEKWKKLATLDDLTGLPNRICFSMYWSKLRDKATICIVDIDFFKKINDNYGHLKGNEILVRVARILEKNNYCFTSRYGGEEFLISCTNKLKPSQILERMENLRKQIEQDMKDVNITISIGVSLIGSDLQKMFEQADKALYYSKRTGRNKVTKYSKQIDFSTLHVEDKDGNIQKRSNVGYV